MDNTIQNFPSVLSSGQRREFREGKSHKTRPWRDRCQNEATCECFWCLEPEMPCDTLGCLRTFPLMFSGEFYQTWNSILNKVIVKCQCRTLSKKEETRESMQLRGQYKKESQQNLTCWLRTSEGTEHLRIEDWVGQSQETAPVLGRAWRKHMRSLEVRRLWTGVFSLRNLGPSLVSKGSFSWRKRVQKYILSLSCLEAWWTTLLFYPCFEQCGK